MGDLRTGSPEQNPSVQVELTAIAEVVPCAAPGGRGRTAIWHYARSGGTGDAAGSLRPNYILYFFITGSPAI